MIILGVTDTRFHIGPHYCQQEEEERQYIQPLSQISCCASVSPTSACVCFRTRQSHTDTRLFGRLVHVLDHIVVVRFDILSTIMADEELDSFARLNVASEQVNLYFLPRPVPLQSTQVFFLENLPIQISSEVSQSPNLENLPIKRCFRWPAMLSLDDLWWPTRTWGSATLSWRWLVLLRRLSELHFVVFDVLVRRWSELYFVQERPLSWAPMLDSPPICLNCAKFLQKKSYRFQE